MIEGIGLDLHTPARASESNSRSALGHEAPCLHGAAGGHQMVRRLGAQPDGHLRHGPAVGAPGVLQGYLPGQRRELMHDDLRLGGRHRLCYRVRVESVGHDRARPQAAHQVLLRFSPGHPDHLVAARHELRNERSAENACGAGYEDLHDCPSRLIHP
jgi:hypothetical protein